MSLLVPEWNVTNDAPNFDRPINPVFSGIILFINLCSVLACLFIIVLFKHEKALRTVPNCFVLNLTVADMMTSFTHGSVHASLLATGKWTHGLCQYSGVSASFFAGTSLISLALISFERYMSTVRERPLQRHHVMYMVGGVWFEYAIIAAIPWMLGEQYMPEPSNVFCMSLWTTSVPAWTLFALVVQLHLGSVFAIIVTSYYKIYSKVVSIKAQLKGVKQKNQASSVGTASMMTTATGTVSAVKGVKALPGRPASSVTGQAASISSGSPAASLNASPLASSAASMSPLVSASTAGRASDLVRSNATFAGHEHLVDAQPRRPSWWMNMFGRASAASMLPAITPGVTAGAASTQRQQGHDAPVEMSSMARLVGIVVRAVRSRANATLLPSAGIFSNTDSAQPAPGVDQSAINALSDPGFSANTRSNHSDGLNRTRKSSGLIQSLKQVRRRKSSAESSRNKLEQVLFRKSVIITFVFTMNWMPYIAVVMWQFITGYHLPPWYHTFAALGIYANSFTNPIICLLLDTRWVKAAKEMLGIKGPEAMAQTESGRGTGGAGASKAEGKQRWVAVPKAIEPRFVMGDDG